MEFTNRQSKCKKIQKTNSNGIPLSESFYALITDELDFVNGMPAEGTVLDAEVMNTLSKFQENVTTLIYNCLGINGDGTPKVNAEGKADNEILSQMTHDFYFNAGLDDMASSCIIINGVVGVTEHPITGDLTDGANPARFFDFGRGNYTGCRKLYIDWSSATVPKKTYHVSDSAYISRTIAFFYDKGSVTHKNLNINFCFSASIASNTAYGIYGNNSTYHNCDCSCGNLSTSFGSSYGFYGDHNKHYSCNSYGKDCGFAGSSNNYIDCNAGNYSYEYPALASTGYAFKGEYNNYTRCLGRGLGVGSSYGFYGNNDNYSYCTCSVDSPNSTFSTNYGFYGSYNTYSYCAGTGMNSTIGNVTATGRGFSGNYNSYFECRSKGLSKNINQAYGFDGSYNTYDKCEGRGENTSSFGMAAYGFSGSYNTYTGCKGIGLSTSSGYGFYCYNAKLDRCVCIGLTTSAANVYGYCASSSSASYYHIIKNCTFPIVSSHNSNALSVTAINILNAGAYVLRDNIVDNSITAITAPTANTTNFIQDGNITNLSIVETAI